MVSTVMPGSPPVFSSKTRSHIRKERRRAGWDNPPLPRRGGALVTVPIVVADGLITESHEDFHMLRIEGVAFDDALAA